MNNKRAILTLVLLLVLVPLAALAQQAPDDYYRWVYSFVEPDETSQGWPGQVAVTDDFGNIHTVFEDGPYLNYAKWSPATGWVIDGVSEDAPYTDVALAVDHSGNAYIALVSEDAHSLHVTQLDANGSWSSNLVYADQIGYFGHIEMEIDGFGNPAVAADFSVLNINQPLEYIVYFGLIAGVGWVPEVVDTSNVGYLGGMEMDLAGNAHLVYQKVNAGEVMFAERLSYNKWVTTEVYQLFTNHPSDLFLNPQGLPEFLVTDGYSLQHLTWNGQTYWGNTLYYDPNQLLMVSEPRLEYDSGGGSHVSFLTQDGISSEIRYGTTNSAFGEFEVIDRDCVSNSLVLDAADQPVLIYRSGSSTKAAWLQPWPRSLVGVYPQTLGAGSSGIMISGTARVDAVVFGGPGTLEGKFEDIHGQPDAQGWTCVDVSGGRVGAFGKVWSALGEHDPVYGTPANPTPRWAFIDDGLVVPGTGGTIGQMWNYGPRGYVVNGTGGLAGPGNYLINEIWSPVIAWDPSFESGVLEFDAYLHDNLGGGTAGFALTWKIRSTSGNKAADLLAAPWVDRKQALYGGPGWFRVEQDLSGLIQRGTTQIQVSIGVAQLGHYYSIASLDASPAPYIDNVLIRGLIREEPMAMALSVDLPQDSFPRRNNISFEYLALNTIPFDIGRMPYLLKAGDPSDSTYIAIDTGDGPELAGPPSVFYQLSPNPLFDPDRTSGLPDQGVDFMDEVDGIGAKVEPGQSFWRYDFPDSGFIFPGDRVHFYVIAADVDGNSTMLPADTTGFSVFPGDPGYDVFAYPLEMSFRGLPSLASETPGDQPEVLIWFDTAGGQNAWSTALLNLGLVEGTDFDFYSTNAASAGLGNGISRTTPSQLDGYETIVYTSEHETVHLLATLEEGNPGDDVSVLRGWLELGDKNLVLFGDNVASELAGSATLGAAFLSDWVGVQAPGNDVRPVIHGQRTPLVTEIPGSGIFVTVDSWNVDAVATNYRPDEIYPLTGTQRLAEFRTEAGTGGVYSVGAATRKYVTNFNSQVLLFPFAFSSIIDPASDAKASALAARTRLLADLLGFFGHDGSGSPSEVPEQFKFAADSWPNPFNPRLEIKYRMPRAGHLAVKVFDIRGRHIATLVDETRPEGEGRVVWNGTDQAGRSVSSGTYFWRAEAGSETVVRKVSLVR